MILLSVLAGAALALQSTGVCAMVHRLLLVIFGPV